MNRLLASIGLASLLAAQLPAQAKDAAQYPSRPVRIVIPSTPGSPSDLVGRVFSDRLAAALGQPLVVDNRPGATGIIGLNVVAKSAPDGYTLGVIAMPNIVIPSLVSKVPYDTEKDLAAVALVDWSYNVLAVPAVSPLRSVVDLVAAAKANPAAVRFSSGGNGTPSHLAGELFKREAKIHLTHVPYKGGMLAVLAAVGGEVDTVVGAVGPLSSHVKSGKLRALATTAPLRIAAYPDLPTFAELGYPGVQIRDWHGFVATGGTPASVIARLHAEIAKVAAMPEVKQRIESLGMDVAAMGPKEFGLHIRNEYRNWGKLVREAGIKAD
jgi:tripartite-type tricarboxylate transporter receptor subunit TctC